MPNVPPKGAFGRPDIGVGAATEVVDAVATIIGETTPRNVLEIWVGDDAGVPVLVWVRVPDGPASATVGYVAGTPAANGKAAVSWVPLNPLRSDSYRVDRPDGSVVGTTVQGATSLDDLAPRPISGTYKVYSLLAGLVDTTPAVTSTINLTGAPGALSVSLVDNRPSGGGIYNHLVWTAPGYGKPHQYSIWRNGVFYVLVSGDTTSYDDVGIIFGSTMSYTVYPVLSGIGGANGSSNSVAVPQDPPTGVVLSNPYADTLQIQWSAPSSFSYFEIQKYDNTVGVWTAAGTTTGLSAAWTTVNTGYGRVRAWSASGVASGWVTVGPVTPKPPPPNLLAYVNCGATTCSAPHGSPDSFINELVVDSTYAGVQPTLCAEYFWSGFPSYGWQNAENSCVLADNAATTMVFFAYRLQLTPTYMRAKKIRNGVSSDWADTVAL